MGRRARYACPTAAAARPLRITRKSGQLGTSSPATKTAGGVWEPDETTTGTGASVEKSQRLEAPAKRKVVVSQPSQL